MPDPKDVMNSYFTAYENGFNMLNHKAKEELVWFTCKVLPAVQKAWKPFVPRNATVKTYYKTVSASDEAFALFLLKNYKSLPTEAKKSNTIEASTGETAIATSDESPGDKPEDFEMEKDDDKDETEKEDDKDDDNATENVGEPDSAEVAKVKKKERKEKLSGAKLKEAMADYHAWYLRLEQLRDRIDCSGDILGEQIEAHCLSVMKKNAKERNIRDIGLPYNSCIRMATKKLKQSPS